MGTCPAETLPGPPGLCPGEEKGGTPSWASDLGGTGLVTLVQWGVLSPPFCRVWGRSGGQREGGALPCPACPRSCPRPCPACECSTCPAALRTQSCRSAYSSVPCASVAWSPEGGGSLAPSLLSGPQIPLPGMDWCSCHPWTPGDPGVRKAAGPGVASRPGEGSSGRHSCPSEREAGTLMVTWAEGLGS